MHRRSLLFIFMLFSKLVFGQDIVYEDNCRCMLSTNGIPGLFTDSTPKQFKIHGLDTNLNDLKIRKAILLFSVFSSESSNYSLNDYIGKKISFNGNEHQISEENIYGGQKTILSSTQLEGFYCAIDVTTEINIGTIFQEIIPSNLNSNPVIDVNLDFFELVTVLENDSFSLQNVFISSKSSSNSPLETFEFSNKLNPINLNSNFGVATHSSYICGPYEFTQVRVNDQIAGELSDFENFGKCDGVVSNMKVVNNTVIAYENDTANNQFYLNDGVANIASYLVNSNTLKFEFDNTLHGGGSYTNPVHFIIGGYQSTCDTFNPIVSEYIEICNGQNAQFSITGGIKYEWYPLEGLSCYDCPNPTTTTNDSKTWSVRIWNNDSCSVTRTVQLKIWKPKFGEIKIVSSICAENTGSIEIKHPEFDKHLWSYQLNGAPATPLLKNGYKFSNLPSGNYTLSIPADKNGLCSIDTLLTISDSILAISEFEALPDIGLSPHTIYPFNKSVNFTDCEWFVNDQSQGSTLDSYEFVEQGEYNIALVVWRKDSVCADTAYRKVLVYDRIILEVPNVFTPNGDGINESFTVTSNQTGLLHYTLHNRWGDVLKSDSIQLKANTPISIWDGANALEGTYFYQMRFETILYDPITSSGFFDLRK